MPRKRPAGTQIERAVGGRPPKPIDVEQVRALAELGCTQEEAATVLKVHRNTFSIRLKEDECIAAAWQEGQADLKVRLRKAQIATALEGNVIMQIFLGKVILGQSDSVRQVKHTGPDGGPIEFVCRYGGPAPKELAPGGDNDDVLDAEADEIEEEVESG